MRLDATGALRRGLTDVLPRHLERCACQRGLLAPEEGHHLSQAGAGGPQEPLADRGPHHLPQAGAEAAPDRADDVPQDLPRLVQALTGQGGEQAPAAVTEPALRASLLSLARESRRLAEEGDVDDGRAVGVLWQAGEVLTRLGAHEGAAEIEDLVEELAGTEGLDGSRQERAEEAAGPPAAARPGQPDAPGGAAAGHRGEVRGAGGTDGAGPEGSESAGPLAAVELCLTMPPTLSYAQVVAGVETPWSLTLALSGPGDRTGSTATSRASTSGQPGLRDAQAQERAQKERGQRAVQHEARTVPAVSGATADAPVRDLRVTLTVTCDDGPLTHTCTAYVEELAGETTLHPDVALLRPALLQLDSQRPSAVTITLGSAGLERRVEVRGPEVLSARQWTLRGRPQDVAATLAAFVQPQQAEIPGLCRVAAGYLRETTGSSALEGYQADRDRVDATVEAVCCAVHDHAIAYATPANSWAESGQRVRTAEQVLEGRLATCLDTTVLLASVLEHLEIEPVLILLPGHSVLGYWKVPGPGGQRMVMGGQDLVNQVDLGYLGLVETTLLTRADRPTLAQMHRSAHSAIGPGAQEVELAVPVRQAREQGVGALPARVRDEAGEVVEAEYRPAPRSNTIVIDTGGVPARTVRRADRAPDRVEVWKRRLLDLSLRNRLISCPDSALERHDIVELAVPEQVVGAFEDLMSHERSVRLRAAGQRAAEVRRRGGQFRDELDPPALAPRLSESLEVEVDLTEDTYDRALQKLASSARTLVEETGANNLYLAVGSLLWQTRGGREVRSPLVLIPVELTRASRRSPYRLTIDPAGASTPNYCLTERLRVDLGLDLTALSDPEEDDAGLDIDRVLEAVRVAVVEAGLPFRVEATVYLGIFQFGGFRLWKDLEDSWELIARNPLVSHLIHGEGGQFTDPQAESAVGDLDELVARLPVAADSSQAQAVAEALAGHTVVIEGPPGTGKSQTITNLIVRAVADGRRVLFVAEKKAALDVVSRRLSKAGIDDLVLNLHDRRQRSATVRATLARALDATAEADPEGLRAQAQVAQAAATVLARYRDDLHQENHLGMSFYRARTELLATGQPVTGRGATGEEGTGEPAAYQARASWFAATQDGSTLSVPAEALAGLERGVVESLRACLPSAGDALRRCPQEASRCFGFLGEALPREVLPGLLDAVDAVRQAYGPAPGAVRRLMAHGDRSLAQRVLAVLEAEWFGTERLPRLASPEWYAGLQALEAVAARVGSAPPAALAYYHPGVLEAPLDQVRASLVEAKNALWRRLRKAEQALGQIARYRTGTPMPSDAGALLAVVDELVALKDQDASALAAYRDTMPELLAVRGGRWSVFDPQARARVPEEAAWYRSAADLARRAVQEGDLAGALAELLAPQDRRSHAASLRACLAAAEQLGAVAGGPGAPAPEDVMAAEAPPGDRGQALRLVQAWNDVVAALKPFREAGLEDAVAEMTSGQVEPALLPIAFQRGIARASLDSLGSAAGFPGFDHRRHHDYVNRFSEATRAVRAGMSGVLVNSVTSHRDRVTGADPRRLSRLRRELVRKRGGRRVRELFAEYGDLITAVTPCVLVSPDSVARFFPASRQDFDIVVFDEASQIPVASAVGAMGRGRSVVVCGDSRQMPPTSFAELSRDEGEDPDDLVDEESVLGECVAAAVPRHWLSWHYRSQVESLIAFSNQHYYEGRLASFPSPRDATGAVGPDGGGYGISLRRVDGVFRRRREAGAPRGLLRTNPEEADALVQEVVSRFARSPRQDPSIGVVTFNIQQRDLVETRLRSLDDARITRSLDAPDGLFVKNLENVQGDERDTILFSVAFSAGASGEVPLNFGPLNREGGERRFNVAITRARREVVLFVSFDPADLHAERSESVGLRNLKEYLLLAAGGREGLYQAVGGARTTDRHRDEIAAVLREAGVAVTTDVGLSDFRVDLVLACPEEPERPLVAVLLDGPEWGRRQTVLDRDVLPVQVLGGPMGWLAVERVWMPEWLNDPQKVVDRLKRVLGSCAEKTRSAAGLADDPEPPATGPDEGAGVPGAEPAGSAGPAAPEPVRAACQEEAATLAVRSLAPPAPAGPDASVPVDGPGPEEGPTVFQAWQGGARGDRSVLDDAATDSQARVTVQSVVREICAQEAPVALRRLCSLVCGAFGLSRMGETRQAQVVEALRGSGCVVDDDGFVWPQGGQPEDLTSYRRAALDWIQVEEIHPREVRNLVAAVVAQRPDADNEAVVREAFAQLQGSQRRRLTGGVRQVLEKALHQVRD